MSERTYTKNRDAAVAAACVFVPSSLESEEADDSVFLFFERADIEHNIEEVNEREAERNFGEIKLTLTSQGNLGPHLRLGCFFFAELLSEQFWFEYVSALSLLFGLLFIVHSMSSQLLVFVQYFSISAFSQFRFKLKPNCNVDIDTGGHRISAFCNQKGCSRIQYSFQHTFWEATNPLRW